MYLNGTSMQKIARTFNNDKVPSKRGGFWSQSTIKSILTNPLYVGRIRYGVGKKFESRAFNVEGVQETIIEEDTFNRVQELITKRKHYNVKKYPSENAYFSTALKCRKCGASFHPKQQKQNGKYYITYYCNNRQTAKCDCSGISHNKVLNAFEDYISNFKLDKNVDIMPTDDSKEKELLLFKELENTDRKRKRVQQLFIDEQLTSEGYQSMIVGLENMRTSIKNELSILNNKPDELNYDDIKDIVIDIKKN